ncbi:hypothetical protein [Burkholderia cenocepacia]|jgi:hypothetical protein|uniref:Lipoprotein n=1 Tax=Burkholderia cenocepacia (strain ATCC BAA-245 / DSM 16553 / LMG 16656 / NCTC 13227 / J2315 / CF5610) TaxID=216591 RepID=B4EQH5_BURCJ|nr:hypothetical protein [Burkholderia cenocepacia]KIS45990.1 hypothetical protein NP88_7295 [Burkholderia cepacia]KKI81707.1 hypothetical protein WQ49_14255 [Burkholderia cenocepacia]ONR59004.1 hypothetical protein A8E17_15630 [Burkholderia cenocepacia]ONR67507.1 hypothetical protein A8E18_24025 [Burkholderia cenocepacia]ONR68503.1 hypothetical protein A8E23_19685 [Burkholderia cenocepacia]
MNVLMPVFRFRGVVVALAMAALSTACSSDYRGDASALLAVMDTASDYTATLKELYATSPRANAQSWRDIGSSRIAGAKAQSMSGSASAGAADAAPAASAASAVDESAQASSADASNSNRNDVANRSGRAK